MRYRLLSTFTVLAALPLLSALPAVAEDLVLEQAPSEMRIVLEDDGYYRVFNTMRRFETNFIATVAEQGRVLHQLLEIEHKVEIVEAPESERQYGESTVKVSAYELSSAGKGSRLFTIATVGDEIVVDGPYLVVARHGCCAEQSTDSVYSLETGDYLFNATGPGQKGDWVTMGARGGMDKERIIAYHTIPTPMDGYLLGDMENAAAVISYARRDKPLQRAALIASQEAMDASAELDWSPSAKLVTQQYAKGIDHVFVDREGADATLFTDITYRLALDEKTVIEIPLIGDRLDVRKAKLPAGYRLVDIPLERPHIPGAGAPETAE